LPQGEVDEEILEPTQIVHSLPGEADAEAHFGR
jgi:hypothetical protein